MVAVHHRKYLTGMCFDFAIALAERVVDPVFVAVGSARWPHHVAIKIGDKYADVRGLLNETDFLAHHAGTPIIQVTRADVELHAGVSGVEPPYRYVRTISQARRDVREVFPTRKHLVP